MNEFTKEELQIMHLDMTTYINKTPMLSESPSHKALRYKIESMIDKLDERERIKQMINPEEYIFGKR